MIRRLLSLSLVALVVASCRKAPDVPPPAKVPVAVAAYTSGTVSREAAIKVQFTEPVVDAAQVGASLDESPFDTTPSIDGVVVWSDRLTLELRPRAPLAAGKVYVVKLPLAGFVQVTSGEQELEFGFTVMRQSFEVRRDGIRSASDGGAALVFTGALVTADVAEPEQVERVLSARLGQKALAIEWTHAGDRRRHDFVVTGIERGEKDREMTVVWDGKPIGVDEQGQENVAVPGLSTFAVAQVRAVHGDEQYIEVRFTDALDRKQNLAGLIRVGQDRPRLVVEGSVLRIYGRARFPESTELTVEPGVKSFKGYPLKQRFTETVVFAPLVPAVRFGSRGVFIPTTQGLTVPIETANLRAVIVEAVRVPEQNIPQFLQVNTFESANEMKRVGRVVWRQVVDLGVGPDKKNRWARWGLDVRPLVAPGPGGLYRLKLTFARRHILYDCATPVPEDSGEERNTDDDFGAEQRESSYWDGSEEYSEGGGYDMYEGRNDPCHPGFYREHGDHTIAVTRNVIVTDVGLIAKVGSDNSVFIAASDLKTAGPLSGVSVDVLDYQQQKLASGTTGGDGTVRLAVDHRPFVVVAQSGKQRGYVKLDDGNALALAHFDVSGVAVAKGLKGKLYGERGVWRPGDDLFLTFVLFDPDDHVPPNHPVRFELVDPRGKIADTQVRRDSVNGFYSFRTKTAPDAPTGNYTARVSVGGATFAEQVKVETVRPNRLKIGLDFHTELIRGGSDIEGTLTSTWLHGALARFLRADVNVTLERRATTFKGYPDHTFDDPLRRFEPESTALFEGTLDEKGAAAVEGTLTAQGQAPGMLTASFATRVFESGGVYSADSFSVPFSPYERYVGVKLPKGDAARGMLLTDTKQPVSIAVVGPDGKPAAGDVAVEVKIYKVEWKWWWEKGEDASLADYVESRGHQALASGTVKLKGGEGTFEFEIKYPDWGRYLVVAKDVKGGHRSGRVFYCDWPGWAGRAQKDNPGGAAVLAFASDKQEYAVGETVTLTIPTAEGGRGLVSIESGSKVLKADWLEVKSAGVTRYSFAASGDMAPNVFVNVTLVQPHQQAKNDLPIRMYGVIPIKVVDPETRLTPVIETADVFAPESKALVAVKEAKGRPMTYTLAVVDEGLLGLTRFATPNLWEHFYRREALGVRTWDVYELVAGAYGASLERLIAIGGDEDVVEDAQGGRKANRFPPMVRFYGPFALAGGETGKHGVEVPRYLGAVRVMVVAGAGRGFGAADKSVFVRRPLLLLATLPRVLGPDEEVDLPVTVFALEDKVKKATVKLSVSGPVVVDGDTTRTVSFSGPGDQTIRFGVKAKSETGVAKIDVVAEGGGEKVAQTIELDVRMPGVRVTDVLATVVEAGRSWSATAELPGFAGTNAALLEVSRVPPLDLGRRLEYLVHYPHGCVEQTTSGAFPQLYLSELLQLSPERQAQIETNVRAGIDRLRQFQNAAGGFGYWPGDVEADDWSSTYAGHFLAEANKAGYLVQEDVLEQWKRYQRNRANAFSRTQARGDLDQAYRLYTLALAGAPELGAMNRLKESGKLSAPALWRLAAAYELAGKPEQAKELTRTAATEVKPYRELDTTYGSDLRDQAMILETLWLMKDYNRGLPIAKEISAALTSDRPLSTQEIAYALVAMARFAAATQGGDAARFTYSLAGSGPKKVESRAVVVQAPLAVRLATQADVSFTNDGDKPLFVRVIASGLPRYGTEKDAENGLRLAVAYESPSGESLDPAELEQGADFVAKVTVTNAAARGQLRNLALSHLVAAGWEIRNQRFEGLAASGAGLDYQDVRDDRVFSYFGLATNESKTFTLMLNASYAGKFYLPLVAVEAMYDGTINAREKGRWVEVRRDAGATAASADD